MQDGDVAAAADFEASIPQFVTASLPESRERERETRVCVQQFYTPGAEEMVLSTMKIPKTPLPGITISEFILGLCLSVNCVRKKQEL